MGLFIPSSFLSAGSRTDHSRPASGQHLSVCYLRRKLAASLAVCPAFESITPPNRLTINAHTADYISDGYLAGKHLNDSTNRHCAVTDTSLCLLESDTLCQICLLLVQTDIHAVLVPSNAGNVQLLTISMDALAVTHSGNTPWQNA